MSVEYTTKLHAGTDFPAVANESQRGSNLDFRHQNF